jgi:peptidyl-prolyl cis-trans isomerase B (cyclophilin B)
VIQFLFKTEKLSGWLLTGKSYFCLHNQVISGIMLHAEIHTDKGVMKVSFYEKDAPGTVANFIKLSRAGFYDGLTFHRVIPEFVIQGGCPFGTGSGGPGYTIPCELNGGNQFHDRGVLSMAHAGRNTGGSQFFICHNRKNTAHLDKQHTCFGRVTEGLEVIDKIRRGDKIEKIIILEEPEQTMS